MEASPSGLVPVSRHDQARTRADSANGRRGGALHPTQVKDDNVDICYIPMVQSGGVYDLRPSAPNTDDHLHYGVIVCALGARHRSYCSNVARTFMVDPSKEQQAAYNALLAAQVRKPLSAANAAERRLFFALPFSVAGSASTSRPPHIALVRGVRRVVTGHMELSRAPFLNARYSAFEVPSLPGPLHWRQYSVSSAIVL